MITLRHLKFRMSKPSETQEPTLLEHLSFGNLKIDTSNLERLLQLLSDHSTKIKSLSLVGFNFSLPNSNQLLQETLMYSNLSSLNLAWSKVVPG